MATLTVQTTTTAVPYGIEFEDAEEAGDEFNNNGHTFLLVNNTDVSEDLTITVVSQNTIRGLDVQDPSLTLAAGGDDYGIMGPFPPALFNDASGNVSITYSSASFGARLSVVSLG